MNVDKTLFGMNVIVGASGFGGLFLGIVIARVIGMDDGLGAGIGAGTGWMIGRNFLLPYFEKRKKDRELWGGSRAGRFTLEGIGKMRWRWVWKKDSLLRIDPSVDMDPSALSKPLSRRRVLEIENARPRARRR